MFRLKSISFFGILTLSLILLLCSPWTAVAQFGEQRLIPLAADAEEKIPTQDFVVYGRADTGPDAGISSIVEYRQIPNSKEPELDLKRMPDLDTFFGFGGTLELLTPEPAEDADGEATTHNKHDLVISEIMWAIDEGVDDDAAGTGNDTLQFNNQEIQWIELYNTTGADITAKLYFLFTPFESHPVRETVEIDGTAYKVLDTVDTLFTGLWKLPGKRGDRPDTAFVSAYRNIDYDAVETGTDRAAQLAGIPFGSDPNSWVATPDNGRRNTDLRIIYKEKIIELLVVATPGAKHVTGVFVGRLTRTPVLSDTVVINEVRNDTSKDNVDWVELKNVSTGIVDLKDWELSIVTGVGVDNDLVNLPEYEMDPGEILLLLNQHPWNTPILGGADLNNADQRESETERKFLVDGDLILPNTGKFVLLLRNKSDQNKKDNAIQDYAGNGFFDDFTSDMSTRFWPRIGQQFPSNVAAFGDNTFASRDRAWARIRYQTDDGHHKDAWENVDTQGGLGYDPGASFMTSPGTPGYDNAAIKSIDGATFDERELTDGEISISEIMYDLGPNRNQAQWIEFYNSSPTQALNLKGWELRIRNLHDGSASYIEGTVPFKDAVIHPNQTLLIVSKKAGTDVPGNRVYDLYLNNRRDLRMVRSQHLLNPTGFHLTLTDTGDPEALGDDLMVDEVGNLTVADGVRSKAWDLPEVNPERRRSIVRLYGGVFKPEQGSVDGEPSPPDDGLSADGWHPFSEKGRNASFYGMRGDLANPGYRSGGPLPVELSSFRPTRMETGAVRIKWRTESELNNAGFNILRSEIRDGDFAVINVKGIIPGHGTSSEQHLYSYTDTTAKPNVIYYYRIEDVSLDGARQTLATVRLKGDISAANKLTTTWSELKSEK